MSVPKSQKHHIDAMFVVEEKRCGVMSFCLKAFRDKLYNNIEESQNLNRGSYKSDRINSELTVINLCDKLEWLFTCLKERKRATG